MQNGKLASVKYAFLLILGVQTCKAFKEIIEGSVVIQYALELALCGYIDGPATSSGESRTTLQRLELLRERCRSWKNLGWSTPYSIEVPSTDYFTFRGGVYTCIKRSTLTCIEFLPAIPQSNGKYKQWQYDVGFTIDGFITDPEQDLLIIAERLDQPRTRSEFLLF